MQKWIPAYFAALVPAIFSFFFQLCGLKLNFFFKINEQIFQIIIFYINAILPKVCYSTVKLKPFISASFTRSIIPRTALQSILRF